MHVSSIIVSFVALLAIPCAVVLAIGIVGKLFFGKPWPTFRDLGMGLVSACGITVGITLAICSIHRFFRVAVLSSV